MLNKIHGQYMCYSDTLLILSGTMTLPSYDQTEVPEYILDGIFSDEEMLQWKLAAKSKEMLNRRSQCTQVKIEPIETRKHKLNNKKKIVLRHILTIFHLSQEHCSYAPFLFMFLMFFLPSVVSNVTTLILSLVGSTLVIILHLIYVM